MAILSWTFAFLWMGVWAQETPVAQSVVLSESAPLKEAEISPNLSSEQAVTLLKGLNQESQTLPAGSVTAQVVRTARPATSPQVLLASLQNLRPTQGKGLVVGEVISGASASQTLGAKMSPTQRDSLASVLRKPAGALVRGTQFNPTAGVDNVSHSNVMLSQFAPLLAVSTRHSLAAKEKITTDANSVDQALKKFLEARARGEKAPLLPPSAARLVTAPAQTQNQAQMNQTTQTSQTTQTPQIAQTSQTPQITQTTQTTQTSQTSQTTQTPQTSQTPQVIQTQITQTQNTQTPSSSTQTSQKLPANPSQPEIEAMMNLLRNAPAEGIAAKQ